jgi:hypothetical protein
MGEAELMDGEKDGWSLSKTSEGVCEGRRPALKGEAAGEECAMGVSVATLAGVLEVVGEASGELCRF